MRPSPKTIVLILAILTWLVVGWPFNRRYHPIAEGFFELAFGLSIIVGPTFLEWLDSRFNKKSSQRK